MASGSASTVSQMRRPRMLVRVTSDAAGIAMIRQPRITTTMSARLVIVVSQVRARSRLSAILAGPAETTRTIR